MTALLLLFRFLLTALLLLLRFLLTALLFLLLFLPGAALLLLPLFLFTTRGLLFLALLVGRLFLRQSLLQLHAGTGHLEIVPGILMSGIGGQHLLIGIHRPLVVPQLEPGVAQIVAGIQLDFGALGGLELFGGLGIAAGAVEHYPPPVGILETVQSRLVITIFQGLGGLLIAVAEPGGLRAPQGECQSQGEEAAERPVHRILPTPLPRRNQTSIITMSRPTSQG